MRDVRHSATERRQSTHILLKKSNGKLQKKEMTERNQRTNTGSKAKERTKKQIGEDTKKCRGIRAAGRKQWRDKWREQNIGKIATERKQRSENQGKEEKQREEIHQKIKSEIGLCWDNFFKRHFMTLPSNMLYIYIYIYRYR